MLHTNRRQIITHRQKLILLGTLNIISLINISTSAPLSSNRSQSFFEPTTLSFSSISPSPSLSYSSSSTLSSKKRTLDEGGNPSELAWQAWLLFDNEGGSDAKSASDSANIVRRITPKSIFIAPPLPACPDGYESDVMNRCVKNVKIDQDAHIDFLLQRLNAMYANLGKPQPQPQPVSPLSASSSSSSSSTLEGTGPFQFNIPLIFDTVQNDPLKVENIDTEEPKKTFLTFSAASNKNNKSHPSVPHGEDTIVTVYEVKDTKKENGHEEKDEKIFFIENQSVKDDNNDKIETTNGEELIPIVEFVQETNSNISDIVDYNIPVISMSQIQNRTALTHVNHDVFHDKHLSDDKIFNGLKKLNVSSTSSTLDHPSTPSQLTRNDSNDHILINTDNQRKESETHETINVNSSGGNITSVAPIKILFNDSEPISESPKVVISANKSYVGDENEETTYYTDEDVDDDDDTTDHTDEDFDSSTENNDEILKHSEAGISVTIPTINSETTMAPPNKDIIASTTFSTVTTSDDFIQETTLLSLNIDKSVNISKDSATNDEKTSTNSSNEEKIVIVTPKSQIVMRMTFPLKEIVPIINLNNEENTESSVIPEKNITELSEARFETQTGFPQTTQIDEISVKNSDNINPVVTIEEASAGGVFDRQPQTSLAETVATVPTHLSNDNESNVTTNIPDSSEIFTALSTNVTKNVLSRDEIQEVFPLTLLIDDTHSAKHIRASSPPRPEKVIDNLQSFSSVDTDKRVYNYDVIFEHHPNQHAYKHDDNQSVMKTFNNQRFELNKNHNRRQNFFPNNFSSFFDSIPNYVKSQTYNRPEEFKSRARPGHVRFPSDEANSIHTPDNLKERFDQGPYSLSNDKGSTRTGTGTLKQSNRGIASGWRSDRQQPSPQRSKSNTNEQGQRNRSPMLMKFWTKMPLVKDPSLLYHPTYPTVVPADTVKQQNDQHLHSLRRVNFYNERSLFDRTRTFAQHSTIDD